MRRTRLRLRSAILVVLATLTVFFLSTLYVLVWSTDELEQQGQNQQQQREQSPEAASAVPFWSVINHPNIYDLYAKPANPIFIRPSNITPARIEELYQLIRNARTDEAHSSVKEKPYAIDPAWHFHRFVEQHSVQHEESETRADPADSDAPNVTTTTTTPKPSTSPKPITENDKLQLRNYIHRVLGKWKREHENDNVTTVADLMKKELAEKESS